MELSVSSDKGSNDDSMLGNSIKQRMQTISFTLSWSNENYYLYVDPRNVLTMLQDMFLSKQEYSLFLFLCHFDPMGVAD